MFFNGQLCDYVDIARIAPECPGLLSKNKMKSWNVLLDFGDQETQVRKYSHTSPFIKNSQFLDIFDMGPPETFDRTQVPKEFWIDSDLEEGLTRQEETRAFEEYRKSGGRYPALGKVPTTPPSFPRRTRTSEGGCVDCESGCDDSLKRRARGPKKATLLTEPRTASTDSDMPDLE